MDPLLRFVQVFDRSSVGEWVQLFILAGFAWFLLRSRAIRALQQSMREQGRRLGSLEREVSRLSGLLERFGCTDAIECKYHRPFATADVFAGSLVEDQHG